MEPQFDPVRRAGWQISNLPILSLAPYLASVDMFDEVGMDAIIERDKITAYLEFVLGNRVDSTFEIITPADPAEEAVNFRFFCMKDEVF
jgi:kynureninase